MILLKQLMELFVIMALGFSLIKTMFGAEGINT